MKTNQELETLVEMGQPSYKQMAKELLELRDEVSRWRKLGLELVVKLQCSGSNGLAVDRLLGQFDELHRDSWRCDHCGLPIHFGGCR